MLTIIHRVIHLHLPIFQRDFFSYVHVRTHTRARAHTHTHIGIAKYGLTQTLRSKFSPSFGNLSGRGTNSRGGSGKGRRTFSLRGTAASTPGSGSSDSDGAPSRAVHGWTPPAPLPAPPHKDSIQLRHIRMEKANVHPMVMLAAMQGQQE